jgi:hypothetical protein
MKSRPEHDTLSATERAVVKARQGVELITSGELRVVDEEGRRDRRSICYRDERTLE